MRYFLAVILSLSCYTASADVYVATSKTGEIYSLSSYKDAVLPSGYTVVKVPGDINQLGLSRDVSFYKFENGKFVIDAKKVKAVDDAAISAEKEKQKKESDKISAINKLKALGLNDNEILALIGK